MHDLPEQLRDWSKALAKGVEPANIDRIKSPMSAADSFNENRRWLAVATSVLVVAAGIFAIANLGRNESGRISPSTNPPSTETDSRTATTEPTNSASNTTPGVPLPSQPAGYGQIPAVGDASIFYLPDPMPADWHVSQIVHGVDFPLDWEEAGGRLATDPPILDGTFREFSVNLVHADGRAFVDFHVVETPRERVFEVYGDGDEIDLVGRRVASYPITDPAIGAAPSGLNVTASWHWVQDGRAIEMSVVGDADAAEPLVAAMRRVDAATVLGSVADGQAFAQSLPVIERTDVDSNTVLTARGPSGRPIAVCAESDIPTCSYVAVSWGHGDLAVGWAGTATAAFTYGWIPNDVAERLAPGPTVTATEHGSFITQIDTDNFLLEIGSQSFEALPAPRSDLLGMPRLVEDDVGAGAVTVQYLDDLFHVDPETLPVPEPPDGWVIIEWVSLRFAVPPELSPFDASTRCSVDGDDQGGYWLTIQCGDVTLDFNEAHLADTPITHEVNGLPMARPDNDTIASPFINGGVRVTGVEPRTRDAILNTVGVSSVWRLFNSTSPSVQVPDDWQWISRDGFTFAVPPGWPIEEQAADEPDPDSCPSIRTVPGPRVLIGRGTFSSVSCDVPLLLPVSEGVRLFEFAVTEQQALSEYHPGQPVFHHFLDGVDHVVRVGFGADSLTGLTIAASIRPTTDVQPIQTQPPASTPTEQPSNN